MKKLFLLAVVASLASSFVHATAYYRNDKTDASSNNNLGNLYNWYIANPNYDPEDIENYPKYINPTVLPGSSDTVTWWANTDFNSVNSGATNNIADANVYWNGITVSGLTSNLTIGTTNGAVNYLNLTGGLSFSAMTGGATLALNANIRLLGTQTWTLTNGGTAPILSITRLLDLNGNTLTIDNVGVQNQVFLDGGIIKSTGSTTTNKAVLEFTNRVRLFAGNSFDGSTVRLQYSGTGNTSLEVTNGQTFNGDIEVLAGASFKLYGQYGGSNKSFTYTGSFTGLGGIQIEVAGSTNDLAPSTNNITGSSPTYAGAMIVMPSNDAGLRICKIASDTSLGIGTLYFPNSNGRIVTLAGSQDVSLQNSKFTMKNFAVNGDYSITLGGTGRDIYAEAQSVAIRIDNTIKAGKYLNLDGDIYSGEAGDWNGFVPLTFLGTGTTVINGTIRSTNPSTALASRFVVVDGGNVISNGVALHGRNSDASFGTQVTNGGSLYINGDWSAATFPVVVSATSTLGGYGTVGGLGLVDGKLVATYSSIAQTPLTFKKGLTLNGELVLNPSASVLVQGAALTIADNWKLTLAGNLEDWDFSSDILLFTYDPTKAPNISLNAIITGFEDMNYTLTNDNVVGKLWLTGTIIPEPATFALLGLSGLAVVLLRRKKVS